MIVARDNLLQRLTIDVQRNGHETSSTSFRCGARVVRQRARRIAVRGECLPMQGRRMVGAGVLTQSRGLRNDEVALLRCISTYDHVRSDRG
jgi:hypothetical protein